MNASSPAGAGTPLYRTAAALHAAAEELAGATAGLLVTLDAYAEWDEWARSSGAEVTMTRALAHAMRDTQQARGAVAGVATVAGGDLR